MDVHELIREAERRRVRLAMNDQFFARRVLGLSPSYWSKLKSGQRSGAGGRFLHHLLARYPDLALSLPAAAPVEAVDPHIAGRRPGRPRKRPPSPLAAAAGAAAGQKPTAAA